MNDFQAKAENMHRLFVAIRPPEAIRNPLLALMRGVEGARWQDDAQLHLTLRFIGEVERQHAEDIAQTLATLRCKPFPLEVAGVGTFDKKGMVHTLWAGIAPSPDLAALHAKIDRALIKTGLASDERRFSPHITLARLNRASGPIAPFLAENAALRSLPWTAPGFSLFESHMGRSGAHYEEIAVYPCS